eukprot:1620723-Pyramimonas_sp.AAC.1
MRVGATGHVDGREEGGGHLSPSAGRPCSAPLGLVSGGAAPLPGQVDEAACLVPGSAGLRAGAAGVW